MPTLNISLPDQLREWVSTQIQSGRYSSASDYLRDLIRSDQRVQHEADNTIWQSDKGTAQTMKNYLRSDTNQRYPLGNPDEIEHSVQEARDAWGE